MDLAEFHGHLVAVVIDDLSGMMQEIVQRVVEEASERDEKGNLRWLKKDGSR